MADQNFMDLASKTASGITGTDYMMLVNNSEAYKALVNDVAEAILGKLTSKSFSGLETTAKNLISAVNELNSKSQFEQINLDLDTLQDSNQRIVVGTISTSSDGKYPAAGIFVHIKATNNAFSQFIFPSNHKMFHRRFVGEWKTWYEYTGTSWTQST